MKRVGNCSIKLIFIFLIMLSFKFNQFFLGIFFSCSYEMKSIENYFRLCNNGKLMNKNKYKLHKFPKISIISPIYNREEFIMRFLRSIQNQKFNDFEIIFIDDCSKDNSLKVIEKYQEKDQRIILIKNKKNKGTLISRNIGTLNSRGEYLIFPDPDDIISKNIIIFVTVL